jgi:hypothetical protein
MIHCSFTGQAKENPSLSATESFSFRICYLNRAYHSHLAEKSRFFEQSENQVHGADPAVAPEFSDRNSGSSFFE